MKKLISQKRYMFDRPFPTPEGLAMGGIIVVERNPDGTLAIDGNEQRILGLLSMLYGNTVPSQALDIIRYMSTLMPHLSDEWMEEIMDEFRDTAWHGRREDCDA